MPTYLIKRKVAWTLVAYDEAEIEFPYELDEIEWEKIVSNMEEEKKSDGGSRRMKSHLRLRNSEPLVVHWQEVELDNPLEYGEAEVVDVSYEIIDWEEEEA